MRTIQLQNKEWCEDAMKKMNKAYLMFPVTIIDLSGELEEDIYVAIFNDDSRILFTVNVGYNHIELLFPISQGADYDNLDPEEKQTILLTILISFVLKEKIVKLDDCSYWD